jgi:hemoglobin/transferrin/lactoferrin receptor protein
MMRRARRAISLIPREGVLSLLFLALIVTPVQAFVGRVVDAEGRPVAGAEITILGRPGESRTDAEGRFTWTPDPPTPFEILVVAPGGVYMKPVLVERIPEGVLEITVMPLVSEVVTVSGSAGSIEATPAAGTTTVTARELAARAPANLVQALENVAGVNQVSEGHAAVPAVRGLARGRTLILIDGARVTAERRVGPSATFLDPEVIEAVEVARGPGSVAYGSDAFGGVISVRTRTVAPGAPLRARVMLGAGAVIPERRAAVEVSRGFDRGGVLLAAHIRDAEDYSSPEGEVFNSGYANRGVLGRVSYQIGEGLLSVAWQSDLGRDIERPRTNARTVRFYYPTEDSHRLTANYDVRDVAGFSRVLITGFVGRYEQVTNQDRFATATSGRRIERADVRANDFQARTNAERRMGRARLELGVDVHGRYGLHALDEFEDYALDGTLVRRVSNVSVDTARRIDAGAYASIDAALTGVISAAAGIRGDRMTTRNRGGYFGDRSTVHGAASGFVALGAGRFGGWSAALQLARGFRDPVLSDRYYRGPTGRGFITGNPELDPEKSLQLDLSLHYTAPRLRAGVYVYQYRIDDLIERYETEPDFFFFRNRGRARIRGVETELQGTLGGGVTIDAAFQLARGRALDDASPLDDMPPETLAVVVRKAFSERNAYVQLRGGFYAEDTRPGPTERVMPGYTLVDAAGGLRVLPSLELRVTARNLLNESYLASPDTRAVRAPGRSVGVTAVVRFGG